MFAIDGSAIELPNSGEIRNYFGVHFINDHKKEVSLARLSQCFDVLNHIIIDSEIGLYNGKGSGEQECAIKHIACLKEGDVILVDRNYACFYLLSLLKSKNIQHCSRLKTGSWNLAKELLKSDAMEMYGEILPSKASKKKCQQLGISIDPIKVRLVKVVLETGEVEVLMTSLLDNEKYDISMFGELYFSRWSIEEEYKEFKHKLEIENFSGKSVLSIQQDVYAKVFTANITTILTKQAQNILLTKKGKHFYKVNRTNAYSKMKNILSILLDPEKRNKYLTSVLNLFLIKPIPIRKNRVHERNFGIHARRYYMNYKAC